MQARSSITTAVGSIPKRYKNTVNSESLSGVLWVLMTLQPKKAGYDE
jgi:hypothetical protein